MSELRADTITASDGTGPVTLTKQSAAKHWLNLNQTGTQASRDSLNFTSLVDNGTADTTVNFASNFNNANYALNITANNVDPVITDATNWVRTDPTSSTYRLGVRNAGNTFQDSQFVCCNVNGDLA